MSRNDINSGESKTTRRRSISGRCHCGQKEQPTDPKIKGIKIKKDDTNHESCVILQVQANGKWYVHHLFQDSLQALQDLYRLAEFSSQSQGTYLELNLSLGNILLAATAAGNALGLSKLGLDSLVELAHHGRHGYHMTNGAYLRAEVLKGEALNGVDAELRVGLNDGESTRDYIEVALVTSMQLLKYLIDRTYGRTACWLRSLQ